MKNITVISLIGILTLLFSISPVSTAFALPFGNSEFNDTLEVPIIMYHNISNNDSSLNKFVITPNEFEQDLKYLKENNYETIFMSDLIDYVYEGRALPDKPIVLTFDDGSFSIDKYAFPLLEKYDMKAVVSIIGKVTDEYSSEGRTDIKYYPSLTWKQINKLIESGLFEIQNHTYDLHKGNGAKKDKGESEESYGIRLTSDLNTLQSRITEMTNRTATTFTYPFGAISSSSDDIIKSMGFYSSLSCNEKVNKVTIGDKECLYSLGRFIRSHGVALKEILSKLQK